jgi:hypothetical protein
LKLSISGIINGYCCPYRNIVKNPINKGVVILTILTISCLLFWGESPISGGIWVDLGFSSSFILIFKFNMVNMVNMTTPVMTRVFAVHIDSSNCGHGGQLGARELWGIMSGSQIQDRKTGPSATQSDLETMSELESGYCLARCKQSANCYGEIYFTGKSGTVISCSSEQCAWSDKIKYYNKRIKK